MSDEYLWDRTGEPEPEVARLEKALAQYRYSAPVKPRQFGRLKLLAVAASLVLFLLAGLWFHRRPLSDWQIAGKRIVVGQTIDTNSRSGAKLEAPFFVEVN